MVSKGKTNQGFSIVELIIAMGIMAVLIGLGLLGFQILQKNSRDTSRVTALSQISKELNNYNLINLNYPDTADVNFSQDGFLIQGQLIVELDGHKTPGAVTDTDTTIYYYEGRGREYLLCLRLESSNLENAGTVECTNEI